MDRRDFLKGAPVLPFLDAIATSASFEEPPQPNPRKIYPLDGSDWQLCGFAPGEGEKLGVFSNHADKTGFQPVTVPNDVQLLLRDPYGQGRDVIEINRKEWWYVRSFRGPEIKSNQQARLVFEGVDYFADVWLNGEKLGSHEGAFTDFAFDITRWVSQQEENYLAVKVAAPWKVPGRSHFEFMKGGFKESWDAPPGPGRIARAVAERRNTLWERGLELPGRPSSRQSSPIRPDFMAMNEDTRHDGKDL